MEKNSTISALEGWLLKEKSRTTRFGLGGDLNKRWFKVERFEWNSAGELALAYYKASTDGRCRGWLYLRDITYIREEGDTMIFCSPARTLRLQAPTRAEHRLWVKGMVKLCPQALTTLERSKEAVQAQQLLVETAQTTPTSDSGSAQSDRDYGCSTPPPRGAVPSPFASPQKGSRKESNSTSRSSSKKKTQKHARNFSSTKLEEEEMGNIHSPVRFGSSGEGSNSLGRDGASPSQVSSRSGRGALRRQSSTLSRGGFFEEDYEAEDEGRPAERKERGLQKPEDERDDGDDGQRRRSSKARKRSTNQTDRDETSGDGNEERGGQKRRQERRRGTSSGSSKAAADGQKHESPEDSDEQQRNTTREERRNSSRSSTDASTDRRDLRKDSWARRRGHEEEDEDEEEEEREERGREEEEELREEEEAGGDGSIRTKSDRSEGSRGALLTYERSRGGQRTAQRGASRLRQKEDVECEGSTSKDNVEHNNSGTRQGGGRWERGHRRQESRADNPSSSSAMASRRRSVKKDRTEGSRGGDPFAAEASRAQRGEDVDISDLAGDGDPLGPEVDEVLLEDAERHGSGLSFEEPPEMRMRQSAQRAADRGGGKKSKSKSKSDGSRSSSSSSNSSGSARRAPSSAPPKPRQFLEVRQEVENSPSSSNEGSKGLRLAGTTTKAEASTESGRQTTSRSGKSREGGVGVTSEEPCPPFVRRRKSIMDELDPALTSSSGPLQLDDGSDEEGGTSIDLEMEKQRRKASAALTALKAAAKKADQHSHHMEQRRAKSGKRVAGGQRQKQHGADQLEGAEEEGEEEVGGRGRNGC